MTYSSMTTKYNLQKPQYGNAFVDSLAGNPYSNFLARREDISTNSNSQTNDIKTRFNNDRTEYLKPKGRLVKGSIFSRPSYVPTLTTIKDFGKALKGEGTDYTLGNLNDPAIALSSLAIAGTLASTASSPFLGAMEFVGAGSWLGSMAMWSKAALAPPVKAMTGVDMNLEYVNAQGEQKPFFRDPQYIPWDLMDDKRYNEMGRKLHVSEDTPNRKEEIQRRATKVATGVNTWWMLSAGFSTPIIASVVANRLERPVNALINGAKVAMAEAHIEAAGYDTGSKNILTKLGKKILKSRYEKKAKALENEVKPLHKLVDENKFDEVEKFYEKLGKDKDGAGNTIKKQVKDVIKSLKECPDDDESREFLKKAYGETKRFTQDKPLLSNLVEAFNRGYGAERSDKLNKISKKLGITGKKAKEMADFSRKDDIDGAGELLAGQVRKVSKKENILDSIQNLADPVVEHVKKSTEKVKSISENMSKKYSMIDASVVPKLQKLAQTAEEKLVGIEQTFNFKPLFKEAQADDLPVLCAGTLNNKRWNNLQRRIPDEAERVEHLERVYGTEKESSKRVVKELFDFSTKNEVHEKDALKSTMERICGESKAFMLADTAKRKGQWFKRVGIFGLGALAVSTATALVMIAQNAKKDSKSGNLGRDEW